VSAVTPWRAYCMRRYLGNFMTLGEARKVADDLSSHPAISASAINDVTGERWHRGRDGWRKTAEAQAREPSAVPMPHEADR
jgi:hypothetical protein